MCLFSFETDWKILKSYGKIRTALKLSRKFCDYLGISEQFWNSLEDFEVFWKYPDSFGTVRKVLKPSWNIRTVLKIIVELTHSIWKGFSTHPPSCQNSVWTAPFSMEPFPFSPLLPRSTFCRVGLLENYFAILICDGACFQACHYRLQCLSLCLIISVMEH